MTSSQIPILEGAEFREVWEERLTREAKKSVRLAVRKGKAVEDPGLASVAVSLARKYQRIFPTLAVVVAALLTAFWVGAFTWLVAIPDGGSVAYWRFLAALWVVMVPARLGVFFLFQRPRYRQAEKENLLRVEKAL